MRSVRLAAFALVALATAASAQTVRLAPARMDGNPLFDQHSASYSGAVMVDGAPAGLPVPLDSVQHARIGFDGTPDTLVVAVGRDAGGVRRVFAGAAGAALVPVVPGSSRTPMPVAVATMTTAGGSEMVFDLSPEPGFLTFRRLDAHVGLADLDGTTRAVALVRGPTSGTFAVGPDLSVVVDGDGDGILETMGDLAGGAAEGFKSSDPFRVGGRAFRVAAVAPDGSEVTFEPAPDDAEALAVGFRMPDLALERLDGTPTRLSNLRGRVVVLNWWTDSCGPCYGEMPGLTALAAAHAADPRVAFVAVARNTRDELAAALVGRAFGYEQTAAGDAAAAVLGEGFPRHVILDADGRVLFDTLGGSPNMGAMLEAVLAPILAAAE